MCGLVGIAGNLAFKDEATMKRLLVIDVFRGHDSTGLAAVRLNGEIQTAKLSSHPLDLIEMPRFKAALSASNSSVFLGHNRSATRGSVTTFNAHPYTFGDITGAHNGTLDYQSTKRLEEAIGETYPVDSMALFAAIDKLGVEQAIELCEEGKDSTTGAWSLTWYDASDNSLNFLRNKHRPMWLAYTKAGDRVFWASEYPMIEAAVGMSAAPYEMHKEGKEGFQFFKTEENTHYKFDVSALIKGHSGRPKPKAKIVKGREPKPVVSAGSVVPFQTPTTHGGGASSSWPRRDSILPSKENSTTTSRSNTTNIDLDGDATHPFAGVIDPAEFVDMVKNGCQWCEQPVDLPAKGCTIYEKVGVVICPDCTGGRQSTKIYVRDLSFLTQ
jgi:predicted glutamine amidotransferase